MEHRTDAQYHYSDRLKGERRLELFNDHYLSVASRRLKKKQQQFKLEVATLNPEAKKVEDMAWHWLVAAVLPLLACGYFLYYLFSGADSSEILTTLAAIGGLLLLSGAFAVAFWLGSVRQWVFQTRAAQYPLVQIPFRKRERKAAAEFAEQLEQAIRRTTEKKGYSDDDLFAGEMRMLRRLSESGILSDDIYDSAKKHMLGSNTQAAVATS